MIGQNLDVERISRVVVLVEYDDGRQLGWSVTEPEVVRWEFAGMHETQGTMGEMLVRGVFHRKARDMVTIELQDGTTRAIEP